MGKSILNGLIQSLRNGFSTIKGFEKNVVEFGGNLSDKILTGLSNKFPEKFKNRVKKALDEGVKEIKQDFSAKKANQINFDEMITYQPKKGKNKNKNIEAGTIS